MNSITSASTRPRLKCAVLGIDHEHVFRRVHAVRGGGGELDAARLKEKPASNGF